MRNVPIEAIPKEIAELVVAANFETVLFVGNLFNKVNTNFLKFKEFCDLENYLKIEKPQNSTILIKGSRGMKLERVLELLN